MGTLTKETIQKLTPEAQEAFACFTLADAERRTQRLQKAKHSRGLTWIPVLAAGVLILVFLGSEGIIWWSDQMVPFLVVLLIYAVAQIQVNAINRRLDALIELLESDLRNQKATDDHEEAKAGPANGSQPIRSETNRTSSAAGSRR